MSPPSALEQFNHIKGIQGPYQTWRIENMFLFFLLINYLLYLCQKFMMLLKNRLPMLHTAKPLSIAQQSRVSASKRSSCMSFIASGREATSFSKAPRCLVRADDIFERLGCMLRRDIGIASNNLSRFHSGIWPYGSSSLGLSGSTDSERCSKRTQPARLCKAWSWETIRKEVKHPSKT